jgi:hypothetical protein
MKHFFVRWLVTMLLAPGVCFAQAQPSAMQKAISGLIQQKVAQRGFAANDPRINPTLQASGSAIAGAAAAAAVVTAAGITAPAWITAAVGMGLATLFSAGISLAIDGITRWLFNSDGSVGVQTAPGSTSVDFSVPVMPLNSADAAACSDTSIVNWCDPNQGSYKGCLPPGAPNPTNYCRPGYAPTTATTFEQAMQLSNYSFGTKTTPGTVETKTATDAINALTDQQKAAPVNPVILATIADQAWKEAASQSGYQGLPYDASNPISPSDASSYQSANPSSYPTVGDAVAPQATPSGGTAAAPWTLPASSTATGGDSGGETPTDPNKPTIDWTIGGSGGAVPGMQVVASFTPTLFAAPTGCPAPVSFTMMGKPYAISYGPFCDLMATLAPIFLACGAAAAALIFAESLKS